MRNCQTIIDLKQLLADFNVISELKNNIIEFTFPEEDGENHDHNDVDNLHTNATLSEEYLQQQLLGDKTFTSDNSFNNDRNFHNTARHVVRNLVNSPRFKRLTTTAHHLHNFVITGDNKKQYGIIGAVKRKDKPLSLVFTGTHDAIVFYKLIGA